MQYYLKIFHTFVNNTESEHEYFIRLLIIEYSIYENIW